MAKPLTGRFDRRRVDAEKRGEVGEAPATGREAASDEQQGIAGTSDSEPASSTAHVLSISAIREPVTVDP